METGHDSDFRHWAETEIMAIFIAGMLCAMFLGTVIKHMF